jgi:sugar phosphate isomerase/epimerase
MMHTRTVTDLSRLCLHTITTRPWSIEKVAENYPAVGVRGVSVWRDAVEKHDKQKAGRLLRESGLHIVSYVRGGFFPAFEAKDRRAAIDDNLKMIDEAAELGAPLLVLVCGAVPGQPLEMSRGQIEEGLAAVLPHAEAAGVRLGVEPLHPMYADDRSAIVTIRQANDLAQKLNSPNLGVVYDVYHLWWDPDLEEQTARCGRNGHLFAFHICDWKTPTTDLLLDRGLMGEGCIDIEQLRGWVEEGGFNGFHEVEIFSKYYWAMDQNEFLKMIVEAYLSKV